jgi:predicted helicase
MCDEAKFGPVFHRFTFREAIQRELLTDYQVTIIGVDNAEYREWAEAGRFITIDGVEVTDARKAAGQLGLAKAMRKYGLRRVISFHNRVKEAKGFADSLPGVIDWMPARHRPAGLYATHVSGEMSTFRRRARSCGTCGRWTMRSTAWSPTRAA